MEFRVLGPVEVWSAGRRIDAGHVKQRAVLAVLLLDLGKVVPIDVLIDRVWGDGPPAAVRNNLYGYVARLRAVIAGAGDTAVSLARRPGGYLLQADPDQVDLYAFRRRVRLAAAADDQRAAELLGEALGLWRGPALAGLTSPWLRSIRDTLEQQRIAAVLDRGDIALRQGRHAELASTLAEQAVASPAHERLIGQLMLALYRCGRQADALHWFEQTRRHLGEELGADPGPELKALHQQILRADPALAGPVPACRRELAVPRQLPARVPHFVGRAKELATLTGLLDHNGAQAVVITAIGGTAGVGKTALAVHWAHRVAPRFPDGQLYVNLRGYDPSGTPTTPEDVNRRFLDALGVPDDRIPSDPGVRESLYRSLLADKKMLIVLDNARDAAQVRPLLPGGPGCMVVVTSRNHLASLAASPGAHVLTLDLLSEPDALELVTRRLGRKRVTDEPRAVSELIRLCARLPLAVSIAVARAEAHLTFPLAVLVGELRDASDRLDALDTGDAASSVSAVFSWSYQNLSATAARLFRLLSVHLGPDITIPAAASLTGLPRDHARRALAELTGAHLLAEQAPGRFAFHDLLRAYAADRARAEDADRERRAAAHRLLDHYLHSSYAISRLLDPTRDAISLAPSQPGTLPEAPEDYGQAWAWADAEHQVLLGAVQLAATSGFDAHAWQISWALEPFFYRRGHWHDFAAMERIGLDAAQRQGDVAGTAHTHQSLGRVNTYFGAFETAEAHLSQAVTGFRQLGSRTCEARARIDVGIALRRQGRYVAALAQEEEALRLYRATSHRAGEAGALNNIGFCHIYMGDYRQALSCCEQALTVFSELNDRYGQAHAYDSLGYAYHCLGEHAQAITCYQEALSAFHKSGARFAVAEVLTHLGDTHHATGNMQAACEAWQAASDILTDLNHPDASQVRAKLQAIGTAQ